MMEGIKEFIDSDQKYQNSKLVHLVHKLYEDYSALQHKFECVQAGNEYIYGEIKEEVANIRLSLMKDKTYLLYLCYKEARYIDEKVSQKVDQSWNSWKIPFAQNLNELNKHMNSQNDQLKNQLNKKLDEKDENKKNLFEEFEEKFNVN
jgi:hypothetical protein